MSGTTEGMRQRIERTKNLGSVVHTMKALAASNIGQYEDSVRALEDYYRTIVLGLSICLGRQSAGQAQSIRQENSNITGAVVFGSDLGLVGQFNERLADFTAEKLGGLPGEKKIWVVGERMYSRLEEKGLPVVNLYPVPGSIDAVAPLIGRLLVESQVSPFFIFFNRTQSGASYGQSVRRMLPLDEQWIQEMTKKEWVTDKLPQALGDRGRTLSALIREYLFVTLFRACVESLAAENTSRLAAMQRAEKNIDEMLDELQQDYHRRRQSAIDEELFDIIAGFEALEGG
ncbi:MAG: F0F1 ATP synthase subunit gamma [Phaeodactylibacter sp.]|nr:F0F1 ATP synthase subunit gamma [Phaeodactylibacter sp.]